MWRLKYIKPGSHKSDKNLSSQLKILGTRRVTKKFLYLWPKILELPVNFIVIWCFLIGAYEMINIWYVGRKTALIIMKILGAIVQNLVTSMTRWWIYTLLYYNNVTLYMPANNKSWASFKLHFKLSVCGVTVHRKVWLQSTPKHNHLFSHCDI